MDNRQQQFNPQGYFPNPFFNPMLYPQYASGMPFGYPVQSPQYYGMPYPLWYPGAMPYFSTLPPQAFNQALGPQIIAANPLPPVATPQSTSPRPSKRNAEEPLTIGDAKRPRLGMRTIHTFVQRSILESVIEQTGHGDDEPSTSSNATFKLLKSRVVQSRKFPGCHVISKDFQFTKPAVLDTDIIAVFDNVIRSTLQEARRRAGRRVYKFGVQFIHPDLKTNLRLGYRAIEQQSAESLMRLLENVCQSNNTADFSKPMTISIQALEERSGAGRKKNIAPIKWSKGARSPTGLYFPANDDNLCLAWSLVVGMAYHDIPKDKDHPQLKVLKQRFQDLKKTPTSVVQRKALALMREAGIPVDLEGYGHRHVAQFQDYLKPKGFKIVVVKSDGIGDLKESPIIWNDETVKNTKKTIFLVLDLENSHWGCIYNPAALFKRSICTDCWHFTTHLEGHKCENRCDKCLWKRDGGCDGGSSKFCNSCNRTFNNEECLRRHRQSRSSNAKSRSVCSTLIQCNRCGEEYDRFTIHYKKHQCGYINCKTCGGYVTADHKCCWIPPTEKSTADLHASSKTFKWIGFDFETVQNEAFEDTADYVPYLAKHYINAVAALKVCEKCVSEKIEKQCGKCLAREVYFDNIGADDEDYAVNQFIDFLLMKAPAQRNGKPIYLHRGYTVFAHNGGRYDFSLLIDALRVRRIDIADMIESNGRIVQFSLPESEMKFLDSYSFIGIPLHLFPATFAIEELKKGFFPYLLNTPEAYNLNSSTMPPLRYYDPSYMSVKRRAQLERWYAEKHDSSFNLKKELKEYCVSDVRLMCEGLIRFREIFHKVTKFCPFQLGVTMPSACINFFRHSYLTEGSIGHLNENGLDPNRPQSLVALRLFKWLEHQDSTLKIQSKLNGKEKMVVDRHGNKIFLDGYYEKEDGGKVAIEVNGCFWHGCTHCYRNRQEKAIGGKTHEELHDKTLKREEILNAMGFQVQVYWTCEIERMLESNPVMRAYFKDVEHECLADMKLRSGFYGGRTGACRLLTTAGPGQEIKYLDVTSLYPATNRHCAYPLGMPTLFKGPEVKMNVNGHVPFKGLVNCAVLPPQDLFHPVLPSKIEGKLQFTLCRTCCFTQSSTLCNHSDKEREITGIWTHKELNHAIDRGYQLVRFFSAYHWTEWSRPLEGNKEQQVAGDKPFEYADNTLFGAYVNKFLKLKQEASGYPQSVFKDSNGTEYSAEKVERRKNDYIAEYERTEGIKLDKDNIVKNEGLRFLAKLMLNSFWGKFGQRSDLESTKYCNTYNQVMDLVEREDLDILDILEVGDQMAVVTKMKAEHVTASRKGSLPIAIFTTSEARLHLLKYLERLGDRVIYYDTDSVIFTAEEGRDNLTEDIGSRLGQLTDEEPNAKIPWIVCLGPKQYAYPKLNAQGETIGQKITIRGLTQDSTTTSLVTVEKLKEVAEKLQNGEEMTIETARPKFIRCRGRQEYGISTKHSKWSYRAVNTKGILIQDRFFPFGVSSFDVSDLR